MTEPNFLQRWINRGLEVIIVRPKAQLRGAPLPSSDKVETETVNVASATPVFITKESILTFGGITAASYGAWTVVALLWSKKADEIVWFGYLVSLAILLFVCWQAVDDPRINGPTAPNPLTSYDKKVAYVLAVLNSFQIFLATLGTVKATGV
jgi:hypothetical protein